MFADDIPPRSPIGAETMTPNEDAPDPDGLFTISAGGFSATADAFARDPKAETLWFLSMVGSQTAVKAIWGSLLKQPPSPAHIIQGTEVLSGSYEKCMVPYETRGTWTTKLTRLPVSGGWHAMAYTKWAEYAYDQENFLLLAPSEGDAPELHYRFLDKRSPLPLHPAWAGWLWDRGLAEKEIAPLQSHGVHAYRCSPRFKRLRESLSEAVGSRTLTVPDEEPAARSGADG